MKVNYYGVEPRSIKGRKAFSLGISSNLRILVLAFYHYAQHSGFSGVRT